MRGIDGGGCRSSGQDDRRIGGALEIRGHGAGALIVAAPLHVAELMRLGGSRAKRGTVAALLARAEEVIE